MEETLAAFLAAQDRKGWQPGKNDCCLYLAAWAIWLGHRDPAQHLRGTYDDEAGYLRIIEEADGIAALVGDCVQRIGGRAIARPKVGAIGIVGSRLKSSMQFGAIATPDGWSVLTDAGQRIVCAPALNIWEI